jgi:hypothetical protein
MFINGFVELLSPLLQEPSTNDRIVSNFCCGDGRLVGMTIVEFIFVITELSIDTLGESKLACLL